MLCSVMTYMYLVPPKNAPPPLDHTFQARTEICGPPGKGKGKGKGIRGDHIFQQYTVRGDNIFRDTVLSSSVLLYIPRFPSLVNEWDLRLCPSHAQCDDHTHMH